jgi:hypothetical protein
MKMLRAVGILPSLPDSMELEPYICDVINAATLASTFSEEGMEGSLFAELAISKSDLNRMSYAISELATKIDDLRRKLYGSAD